MCSEDSPIVLDTKDFMVDPTLNRFWHQLNLIGMTLNLESFDVTILITILITLVES